MIRLLVALTVMLGVAPRPGHAQALLPDTVLSPPSGPRIVLLEEPGTGLAAFRLAIPLPDAAGDAEAALVLRDLALTRMRALAGPVGARVSAARTPWGVAYTVQGAATDLEYLLDILRAAAAEPRADDAAFRAASEGLAEARARAAETPAGKLAATLRAAIEARPAPGAAAPGDAPTPARVRDLWRRSGDPSSMTLVVAAPVPVEVVLAATRGWSGPEEDASSVGPEAPAASGRTPTGSRPPGVDVLRRWYGAAWQGGSAGDPRAAVAAVLVADVVRGRAAGGGYEGGVELVEHADGWVLMVSGAAYPSQASVMRRDVDGALAAARAALDPAAVARAVSEVRREVLLGSRTPAGLVSTVGRAMEASGDPEAAARELAALDRVDVAGMGAFLSALLGRGPVTAEVHP